MNMHCVPSVGVNLALLGFKYAGSAFASACKA